MPRFVTITKWTPETAQKCWNKMTAIVRGEAPKAVNDAWAKLKIITIELAYGKNCSVTVTETEDMVAASVVLRYLGDVATLEVFPTIGLEDALKVRAMFEKK
ncbi:MAG: hypothetical protein AOA66_0548 [Candidatus Bathyarchaeota archaeon BA2]|nr:MAG: hypothetical protein AOA66_0548 [Candidatus Bathyarchaeota archaeon BA2]